MENTKTCTKCGRELPLSEFYKNKKMKDGLQYWCKECDSQHNKQWRAEHKEEKAAYDAERRATLDGHAYTIRQGNLKEDRKRGRCGKDEDPLPSLDYYIWALQQRDFYDGNQYHWSEMGLDRIDNSKPHTIDNVVPCSAKNNRRRQKMPFEEFCELIRKEKEELNLILN